jgi:hypothetical protein
MLIPLLFAIWANCHIGWIIGFAILLLGAGGGIVRGDTTVRSRWLIVSLTSLAATLINPYGWRLWRFSIEMAHLTRKIAEWQPLWTSPFVNWLPWGIAVVLVCVFARRWLTVDRFIVLAGLAYASQQVLKFSPLFVETTVLLLSPVIGQRFAVVEHSNWRLPIGVRILNAMAIAVVAIFVGVSAWPSFKCLRAGDWRPDAMAADALQTSHVSGRLAVWFDWGEYAVWAFGPRLRVSFDPRFDLIYSPETIREQQAVGKAESADMAFLTRVRPEYVWYSQASKPLKAWLPDHGYRIDVDTPMSFIGVRSDLEPLKVSAIESSGCFPAP